jgi:hypothetical protein
LEARISIKKQEYLWNFSIKVSEKKLRLDSTILFWKKLKYLWKQFYTIKKPLHKGL